MSRGTRETPWTGERGQRTCRGRGKVGIYLGQAAVAHFGGSGSCTILLRMLWIWENLGRSPGSFCQQSSISRCRAEGQFLGGGSRKPSSTALMTWAGRVRRADRRPYILPTHTHVHPPPPGDASGSQAGPETNER